MTKPELDVEYDFVAIIEALTPDERTKFPISSNLATYLASEGIPQETAACGTKAAVLQALKHFRDRAEKGDKFCLHIVCHGNKEGLEVKATGEFIPWAEFIEVLQLINAAMSGALVLNMSSCWGLHGIKIVDPERAPLPFFGLVGPNRELGTDEAEKINRSFYRQLMAGVFINKIVPNINRDCGEDMLFNITAEGFRDLSGKAS